MITEIKALEQKIERDRKIINRLFVALLILLLAALGGLALTTHLLFK